MIGGKINHRMKVGHPATLPFSEPMKPNHTEPAQTMNKPVSDPGPIRGGRRAIANRQSDSKTITGELVTQHRLEEIPVAPSGRICPALTNISLAGSALVI
jgi:hypothetical protein